MLRVGLTGGIACGKSHVLRRLAARGCRTLDLDAVAREVTAPGGAALARDRGALRRGRAGRAAARSTARPSPRWCSRTPRRAPGSTRIVHPRVRAAEALWAAGFAGEPGAVLVTDAALLVESGRPPALRPAGGGALRARAAAARLRARDGLDEAAARARDRGADADRGEARVRALRDRQLGVARGHRPRRPTRSP